MYQQYQQAQQQPRHRDRGAFEISLDQMREEMQRQQQAMLNDLHLLRHEANKVSQERTNLQYDYQNLKN